MSQIVTLTDWENVFAALGTVSGVVAGKLNQLAPSLDTPGRNAVIGTGFALLRGFEFQNTSATSTPIPAASGQNRIDRLVLRLDRSASTAATLIVPTVLTGTPGANPAEPALVRTTTGLWDLPVCSWTSAASGALKALADERYFPASAVTGLSTARPVMDGPGMLFETDTGKIALWTGSAWQYLTQAADTWHNIPLANGFTGNLSGEFPPQYTGVTVDGIRRGVAFRGALTTSSSPFGTVFGSVPPAYSPGANVRWAVSDLTRTDLTAHCILNAQGQLIMRGGFQAGDQVDIGGVAWIF